MTWDTLLTLRGTKGIYLDYVSTPAEAKFLFFFLGPGFGLGLGLGLVNSLFIRGFDTMHCR